MTREEAKEFIAQSVKSDVDIALVADAIKALEQEPTAKNDLEIVMDAMEYRTNALIENIKSEIMHFANAHCSGDDINIYDVFKVIDDCCELSNSEIPNKSEMPTSSTTKNDLADGKDNNVTSKITREEVIEQLQDAKIGYKEYLSNDALNMAIEALEHPERNVVAIVPCGDAISRQSAIDVLTKTSGIRGDALKALYEIPSVTPQKSFNPMVEINLYSAIKQKYIEREVFDKLRAEIVELTKCPYGTECLGANCPSNTDCMICGDHVLEIIDKYKGESGDV